MSQIKIFDDKYRYFIPGSSTLEKIFSGSRWGEGPVYFPAGDFILWSDIPNNRMLRWAEGLGSGIFRLPANYSNGNTRDLQGRLISCEHGTRRVTRTEHNGKITVLVDNYQGNKLNSPNDVVVTSDNSIWFTDPPYGILTDYEGHKAESQLKGNFVFHLNPDSGKLTVVADDFNRPNGLAFSPDEKLVYITDTGTSDIDSGPPHIRVFEVSEQGTLLNGKVFRSMKGKPADGLRVDSDGNIWTSAGASVECYSPSGDIILTIPVPERVSNLTFGGPKRNRLFITATTSLYALYVGQNGIEHH